MIRRVKALITTAEPAETADSGGIGTRKPPRIHVGGPSRASMAQEIRRIAQWYDWQAEIDHALTLAAAATLKGLDDDSLAALWSRMERLEAFVQEGYDPGIPDAP